MEFTCQALGSPQRVLMVYWPDLVSTNHGSPVIQIATVPDGHQGSERAR